MKHASRVLGTERDVWENNFKRMEIDCTIIASEIELCGSEENNMGVKV